MLKHVHVPINSQLPAHPTAKSRKLMRFLVRVATRRNLPRREGEAAGETEAEAETDVERPEASAAVAGPLSRLRRGISHVRLGSFRWNRAAMKSSPLPTVKQGLFLAPARRSKSELPPRNLADADKDEGRQGGDRERGDRLRVSESESGETDEELALETEREGNTEDPSERKQELAEAIETEV